MGKQAEIRVVLTEKILDSIGKRHGDIPPLLVPHLKDRLRTRGDAQKRRTEAAFVLPSLRRNSLGSLGALPPPETIWGA